MRRGPQEDDREQQHRHQRDLAGRRDPADQRRERAGAAADDDVLRRARLEPDRVDHRVVEDRDGEDRRRQPADREPHQQHRDRPTSATPKSRADWRSIRPAGSGRLAVRFIPASRSASHHWLSAAAPPGAERDAQDRGEAEHRVDAPGAASSPHSPVNTTRLITRGLVSAKKSRQSAGGREGGVMMRAIASGATGKVGCSLGRHLRGDAPARRSRSGMAGRPACWIVPEVGRFRAASARLSAVPHGQDAELNARSLRDQRSSSSAMPVGPAAILTVRTHCRSFDATPRPSYGRCYAVMALHA